MKKLSSSDRTTVRRLKKLLSQSTAPVTHRKVAALVNFNDGSTSIGYNNESEESFIHAEEAALQAHPQKTPLVKSIFLMASGPPMNIKHALPCKRCTQLLTERMLPGAEAVLFFNDYSGKIRLDLSAISAAYKNSTDNIAAHSLDKTLLTSIDKKLVTFIFRALKSYDSSAELYLTGSAAGRGSPTTLLAREITGVSYWDIDLILLQNGDAAKLHAWFKKTYSQALADVGTPTQNVFSKKEPSYVSSQGLPDLPGFKSHRLYWGEGMPIEIQPPDYKKNPSEPSPIDLSIGQGLTSVITPHYLRRRWYTRLEMIDPSLPAHMRYSFVQKLTATKPNPALLARYLEAIVNDDEAFASAVASMVRIPVGFNTLYVSKTPRLQLNFYRDDITGNEDPHGHPAWARTTWYAPKGALQKIVFHQPLPKGTRRLPRVPVQELRTMSLTNIQTSSGGRPFYGLKPLEPTLVLRRSTVHKATLSSEDFPPWDPHHVTVNNLRGRVAISTHYKRLEEPAALSTFEGLVNYKGLSRDEAAQVLEFRAELSEKIQKGLMPGATRLGPAAVVYTPLDRKIEDMEPLPVRTPPKLAEELLLGGLKTVQELARRGA